MKNEQTQKNIAWQVLLVILVVLAMICVATVHTNLWNFWWYDIVAHILGGAWVGITFFYIFCQREKIFFSEKFIWNLIGALSFVALLGVAWELYEFTVDHIINIPYDLALAQPSLVDTMKDLFNDLLGGFLASLYYWFAIKN